MEIKHHAIVRQDAIARPEAVGRKRSDGRVCQPSGSHVRLALAAR